MFPTCNCTKGTCSDDFLSLRTPLPLLPRPNNWGTGSILKGASMWTKGSNPVNRAYKNTPQLSCFLNKLAGLAVDQELCGMLQHLPSSPEPGALGWALTWRLAQQQEGSAEEGWGRERNFPFLIISQKKEMPVWMRSSSIKSNTYKEASSRKRGERPQQSWVKIRRIRENQLFLLLQGSQTL